MPRTTCLSTQPQLLTGSDFYQHMAGLHAQRVIFAQKARPVVMGGSALGRQAPRLSREVYTQVVTELKIKLVPKFYRIVEEPRSFASKTSFGDVDLLACPPQQAFDPVTEFGSTESTRNGNIKHFDYQGYQVDVIEIEDRMMRNSRGSIIIMLT